MIGHVVGIVEIDNLGRILKDLKAFARDWEIKRRRESSAFRKLKYYLGRNGLLINILVVAMSIAKFVRNIERMLVLNHIIAGLLEVDLKTTWRIHGQGNNRNSKMVLNLSLALAAKDWVFRLIATRELLVDGVCAESIGVVDN